MREGEGKGEGRKGEKREREERGVGMEEQWGPKKIFRVLAPLLGDRRPPFCCSSIFVFA